jgi:3',5'-cyclic AMP phosphodiesterase CpdA
MLTLLHASDIHFGKPHDPQAREAFLTVLQGCSPDLLVLSGDFTQRAKVREYEEAGRFLDELPPIPRVVTPGNHDVPLYRVFERIFAPLRNYRDFISPDLDSTLRIPGATVVSLNSTAPHRAIVNGRISDDQLLFAASAFQDAPEDDIRILVTHHNFIPAPDHEPQQFLPGFRKHLSAFGAMKVELILGGHLHRSFVGSSLDAYPQESDARPIIIAHCGTTTSTRGRARERGRNSLNLIRIEEETVTITPHVRSPETGEFRPGAVLAYPRGRGRPS